MSDPRILLCGPAMNAAESAARLEIMKEVSLPGATKFVVTTGKFDAEGEARAFNIEASYPGEPAYLQTLERWVEAPVRPDAVFRDSYDLYCLRRILVEHGSFDFAVLLRNAAELEARWLQLLSSVEGRPFIVFGCRSLEPVGADGNCNVLFDLRDEKANKVLKLVGDLFMAGAAYAITDYTLRKALDLALGASEIEQMISSRLGEGRTHRAASHESGLSGQMQAAEEPINSDRSISV